MILKQYSLLVAAPYFFVWILHTASSDLMLVCWNKMGEGLHIHAGAVQ